MAIRHMHKWLLAVENLIHIHIKILVNHWSIIVYKTFETYLINIYEKK